MAVLFILGIVLVVVLLVALFLLYANGLLFNERTCQCTTRLDGKTVLITGGEKGIGKQTAIELAKRGARIVLASLDIPAGENTAREIQDAMGKSAQVSVRKIDLSDLESVREFAESFLAEEDRLDVLVNNAGITISERRESKQGHELVFAINHLGHYLLTLRLLPLLRKSTPSRIVTISSDFHRTSYFDFEDVSLAKGYSARIGYGRSKLCNVLFTKELAKRLHGTGVAAFSLHPGAVRTSIADTVLPKLSIGKCIVSLGAKIFLKTPWQGAQSVIHSVLVKDAMSGDYFKECRRASVAAHAMDENAARRLWKLSAELCGLTGETALLKDE